MRLKRAKRVRLHLAGHEPSVEGLLVSGGREYAVAVPQLLIAEGAEPVVLDEARLLMVPRDRVLFYEVL